MTCNNQIFFDIAKYVADVLNVSVFAFVVQIDCGPCQQAYIGRLPRETVLHGGGSTSVAHSYRNDVKGDRTLSFGEKIYHTI